MAIYTLVLVINGLPEVYRNERIDNIINETRVAYIEDPFMLCYIKDSKGWRKGEWFHSQRRYFWDSVANNSVPDIILLAEMVAP
jgi:hypothetical protein